MSITWSRGGTSFVSIVYVNGTLILSNQSRISFNEQYGWLYLYLKFWNRTSINTCRCSDNISSNDVMSTKILRSLWLMLPVLVAISVCFWQPYWFWNRKVIKPKPLVCDKVFVGKLCLKQFLKIYMTSSRYLLPQ